MNADRVINKINHDMNAFNESGGREDKACAEGLRRARTYIQQEVLKRKILTHNQRVVLEWLKSTWKDRKKNCWFPFEVINSLYYQFNVAWGNVSYEEFKRIEKDKPFIKSYGELTAFEQFQVLATFAEWGIKQEEE